MTVAVCIKCGGMKRGALTQCVECHFYPHEREDMGKSFPPVIRSRSERWKLFSQSPTSESQTHRGRALSFWVQLVESNRILTFLAVLHSFCSLSLRTRVMSHNGSNKTVTSSSVDA